MHTYIYTYIHICIYVITKLTMTIIVLIAAARATTATPRATVSALVGVFETAVRAIAVALLEVKAHP